MDRTTALSSVNIILLSHFILSMVGACRMRVSGTLEALQLLIACYDASAREPIK